MGRKFWAFALGIFVFSPISFACSPDLLKVIAHSKPIQKILPLKSDRRALNFNLIRINEGAGFEAFTERNWKIWAQLFKENPAEADAIIKLLERNPEDFKKALHRMQEHWARHSMSRGKEAASVVAVMSIAVGILYYQYRTVPDPVLLGKIQKELETIQISNAHQEELKQILSRALGMTGSFSSSFQVAQEFEFGNPTLTATLVSRHEVQNEGRLRLQYQVQGAETFDELRVEVSHFLFNINEVKIEFRRSGRPGFVFGSRTSP